MTVLNTNLKNDLKNLINSLDYLTVFQKEEWLKICENLNENQLVNLYNNFAADKQDEDNFKLSIIYKTSLGDLYKSKLKEISSKYQTSARKKSEAFSVQTETKADDILNKLNEI
jgi:hypothetical protein